MKVVGFFVLQSSRFWPFYGLALEMRWLIGLEFKITRGQITLVYELALDC